MQDYRDISLKQEDFESAAIIYDQIREVYAEQDP